jgi:uncharacterized protein YndB with AHSA1/START domain
MRGSLEEVDGRWRVRFTRRLAHAPEKVWRALTEPEHLAAWFPTRIEGELARGGPLRFSFANDEAPAFAGEVLAYEPQSLLEFTWGDDTLRLELEPDGDGSILTLTDTLREIGRAARDAAGWHVCLSNLERSLEGAPSGAPDEWKPINAEYVERFGPEASTIGPPDWAK